MRPLASDERELWAKVVATVKPLRRSSPQQEEPLEKPRPTQVATGKAQRRPEKKVPPSRQPADFGGLDGSWDRRLTRGLVFPDATIDLHGHSLTMAHAVLDGRLDQAIAADARLVLLITGKPPRDDHFPVARGAIRASIDAWIRASRHAPHIAAVRNAHPRHGGAGALYLVLRRRRERY